MRGVGITRPLAMVTATLGLLAGCMWPQIGHGPEHRYHNPGEDRLTVDNVGTLNEIWSVDVGGPVTEPMVFGDRVYVANAASTFNCCASASVKSLDIGTGEIAWTTSMASFGGNVLLNPAPVTKVGGELWAGFAGSTFLSPQVCVAGNARLATDGTLLAQDTRQVSATTSTSDVAVRFETAPDCNGETQMVVIDVATAQPLWAAGPPAPLTHSIPTILSDSIYVAADTQLLAYPVEGCGQLSCEPAWSVDLGVAVRQPVGGFDGQVFVTTAVTDAAELVAVSADDGDELWRAPLNASSGRIAVTDDVVYVAAGGGGNALYAYDAGGCGAPTCSPLWSAELTSPPVGPPAVAGDVVYLAEDFSANVLVFDARGCGAPGCEPLSTLPVPRLVRSMSVAQGKLFVVGSVTTGSPPFISTTSTISAYAPTTTG